LAALMLVAALVASAHAAPSLAEPVAARSAPRRVASLNLSSDEVLAEILPPDRLVSVTRWVDEPGTSNILGRIPASVYRFNKVDMERLVALSPDLVVVSEYTDADFLDLIAREPTELYVLSNMDLLALYEEDPTEPAGKRFVGSAIWSTKTVLVSPGRAPELEIRADIKIPERSLTITWSLRRSIEQELPANYAVEIVFTPLPGAPSGVPANVLGVALKVSEQIRGVRLRGPIVKLTDGVFRIDLSTSDSNRKSNMQLLQERPLFDISIVYTNNRRAILAMEMGTPGKRAFASTSVSIMRVDEELDRSVRVA
jgi:hypothetical protein